MNIGEIAERFIRAAEIERASHEHVRPAGRPSSRPMFTHTPISSGGAKRWATSSTLRQTR